MQQIIQDYKLKVTNSDQGTNYYKDIQHNFIILCNSIHKKIFVISIFRQIALNKSLLQLVPTISNGRHISRQNNCWLFLVVRQKTKNYLPNRYIHKNLSTGARYIVNTRYNIPIFQLVYIFDIDINLLHSNVSKQILANTISLFHFSIFVLISRKHISN